VAVRERLQAHLGEVKRQHEGDLAKGDGRAVLPFALDRKYPNASTDWAWQFVFPAARRYLPSLDYETCVAETVRRQLRRPFCRSAEREEEVIRQRFGVHRNLSAAKIETMKPTSELVEVAVANLLPNIRLLTAAGAILSRRG
jgi:hypothetical protein